MKKTILLIVLVAIFVIAGMVFFRGPREETPLGGTNATSTPNGEEVPAVTVIADNLEIPWDIAFLPASSGEASAEWEGDMLVTERTGTLIRIAKDGNRKEISIEGVKRGGEGGLLGIVLHPDFEENRWLYLYYGVANGQETRNRVERYAFRDGELLEKKIIIDNIPGALYHDGGRMEFGVDGKLYVTTGDATREAIAQDKNSLGGKVLRLNDDGSVPSDNPFPGSPVWSYGHRNPQGLAWDDKGNLWETEHGRSGAVTGMDEVNLIVRGGNYGWPEIEGDEARAGMTGPVLHSGARETWAPASLLYYKGSLYFGGLRAAALYEAVLDGTRVTELKKHFEGEFGRIRTVRLGPDGMLYLTTSNRDGRWEAKDGSDKIVRVDPEVLQ